MWLNSFSDSYIIDDIINNSYLEYARVSDSDKYLYFVTFDIRRLHL